MKVKEGKKVQKFVKAAQVTQGASITQFSCWILLFHAHQ